MEIDTRPYKNTGTETVARVAIPENIKVKYDGSDALQQTAEDCFADLYCAICIQSFAVKGGVTLHLKSGKHKLRKERIITKREGGAPAATQISDIGASPPAAALDLNPANAEHYDASAKDWDGTANAAITAGEVMTGTVDNPKIRKIWNPADPANAMISMMRANYDEAAKQVKDWEDTRKTAKTALESLLGTGGQDEFELGLPHEVENKNGVKSLKVRVARYYKGGTTKKLDAGLLLANGVDQELIDLSYVETIASGYYKIEDAKVVD